MCPSRSFPSSRSFLEDIVLEASMSRAQPSRSISQHLKLQASFGWLHHAWCYPVQERRTKSRRSLTLITALRTKRLNTYTGQKK